MSSSPTASHARLPRPAPKITERKLKILYVDDCILFGQAVQDTLIRAGYLAEYAQDGYRALEKFNGQSFFDVIIVDHQMPIIDGLGFVASLRQRGVSGQIIVYSSGLTEIDAAKYRSMAVDAIVKKSTSNEELLQVVATFEHREPKPIAAKDSTPLNAKTPRYVLSRYASCYETVDGSLPDDPSLADVFPEDLTALRLVAIYVNNGENALSRLSRLHLIFRPKLYRRAKLQEQFEADRLSRHVRSEGLPLVAALCRVAHACTSPAQARRRARLIEIAVAATKNESVPPFSF